MNPGIGDSKSLYSFKHHNSKLKATTEKTNVRFADP
jgi:hypothetical protein